jgi:hypothetical protein
MTRTSTGRSNRNSAIAIAVLIVCAAAAPRPAAQTPVAPRTLAPVDEGARDPSWVAFRDRLLRALREHDRDYVLGAVDAEFAGSFGGEARGVAAFERKWKLAADGERSPFWTLLPEILSLGGSFTRPSLFCAPYVYTRFPDGLAAADYGAVIRSAAPLFAGPSADAQTVATLRYEIVQMDLLPVPDRFTHPDWRVVQRANGERGYMRAADVRSPIDYRACFVKRDGAWKLSALLAGD